MWINASLSTFSTVRDKMKVKKLHLQNYGRFYNLEVEFAPNDNTQGNVTIIVGNNGAGKSQILQALATGFSWFVSGLTNNQAIVKHSKKFKYEWNFDYEADYISKNMVQNNKSYSEINLIFSDTSSQLDANIEIYTSINSGFDSAKFGNNQNNLENIINHYRNIINGNTNFNLPLIAFYSVERNVVVNDLYPNLDFKNHQFKGYANCLTAGSDYHNFFQWFRDNEDLENEINKTKYSQEHDEFLRIEIKIQQLQEIQEHIDDIDYFPNDEEKYKYLAKISKEIEELENQYNSFSIRSILLNDTLKENKILSLNAVRDVIEEFTGFKNPRISRQGTPKMVVEKDGEKLDVNQLSQGEKSLLALVGDIARRLAILNPSLDNPLQGEGVVLIDEVDLHLHPKWQQNLVDKLTKTFPNVQFILTTHSPHIVSDNPDVLVYILDNGQLKQYHNAYGEDANTLLNGVFGVSERTPEIAEKFKLIGDYISDMQLDNAKNLIDELSKILPKNNIQLLSTQLSWAKAKLAQSKEV